MNVGAGTEAPLPNLKGGSSSLEALQGNNVVVKPLVRDNEGFNRDGRRRLKECKFKFSHVAGYHEVAHSCGAGCCTPSISESCTTSLDGVLSSSKDVI